MSDELNNKWDEYARVAGNCLLIAGQALQQLVGNRGDAAALGRLFTNLRTFRLAALDMDLPVIAEQAHHTEALCGLLQDIGAPLDDGALMLLAEAHGGLSSGLEMSAVFWRDAGVNDAEALGRRLRAMYQRLSAPQVAISG